MARTKSQPSTCWFLCLMIAAIWTLCHAQAWGGGLSWGDEPAAATEVPALQITPGPFASPVGIELVYARNRLKYLLVTDAGKKTVGQIKPNRLSKAKKLFKVDGLPLGVAAYNHLIYVGNRSEGSVDIYKGKRLLQRIKLDSPMQANDLAIDSTLQRLFVIDGLAKEVKVFTLSGRLIQTIDGFGDLFEPKSVALHPQSQTLAITDAGDRRTGMPASVQLYDYSGAQLLRKTGTFTTPQGVALGADRLFVADAMLGQVQVFNREDGTLLGSFGSFGTDPGQLLFPVDLAFDEKSEILYVVNNRMGRIEAYTPADFQPAEVSQ